MYTHTYTHTYIFNLSGLLNILHLESHPPPHTVANTSNTEADGAGAPSAAPSPVLVTSVTAAVRDVCSELPPRS